MHSTVGFEGTEKEGLLKSGPVRCGAVDNAFIHLITSGGRQTIEGVADRRVEALERKVSLRYAVLYSRVVLISFQTQGTS